MPETFQTLIGRCKYSHYVTGSPVHTYRPRNIPYGNMIRWYIYDTRQPKHPHSTILCYRNFPQGPLLLVHITWNTARTRPKYTPHLRLRSQHLRFLQDYHKNHHWIKIISRGNSFIQNDHRHRYWTFSCCFPSSFPIRLNLPNPIWLRFPNSIWLIFLD